MEHGAILPRSAGKTVLFGSPIRPGAHRPAPRHNDKNDRRINHFDRYRRFMTSAEWGFFPGRPFHSHKNVFSSPVYFFIRARSLPLDHEDGSRGNIFLEKAKNETREKKKLPKRRDENGFRPDRGVVDDWLHYLGRLFSRS